MARPLLASTFIAAGFHVVRHPKAAASTVERVVLPIAARFPALPEDPEQLARISGGVQAGAGVLLALGRFPRLSALALSATLAPTALGGHRFWTVEDPEERERQRTLFLKDLALLGGLLIAVGDTHGKPSLAHRSRRAAAGGRRSARSARRAVDAATTRTAARARTAAHSVGTRLPTV
ncbi:DoxX family protein [Streptomyces sp. NPDC057445]|uniref:DoxX family protein n=1 Tax=Streptomyces sp. NPDC057445 TaxID=3346136 RepID=UPI00368D55BD